MTDDETKAMRDAMIFGTGWLLDGKHVPMEDVMADKLVKWLRRELPMGDDCIAPNKVCVAGDCPCDDANILAAADRIEELKAELAEERRSREEAQAFAWKFSDALRKITETAPFGQPQEIARAALGEKKDG